TVKLPDVTNAATLVTDDEVFVVYRANKERVRRESKICFFTMYHLLLHSMY
ncbi:YhcN/YlaJ family sporulation lipoprotein, partial [Bacillus sp. HC-TM]